MWINKYNEFMTSIDNAETISDLKEMEIEIAISGSLLSFSEAYQLYRVIAKRKEFIKKSMKS